MIVIPDYLIIDEIRRRKERAKRPHGIEAPLPSYEIPDRESESVYDNSRKQERQPKRENGAIIIDMGTYRRIPGERI